VRPVRIYAEGRRLLHEVTAAVDRHGRLCVRAAEIVCTGQNKTFVELWKEVEQSFREAQAALAAYKRHVETHGC